MDRAAIATKRGAAAGRGARRPVAALLAGILAPLCVPGWAQQAGVRTVETTEIAPFRVTGVEGYVQTQVWRDSNETGTALTGAQPPVTDWTRQATADQRAEFYVLTHNYVYHPNLLTLDLGAGLLFDRNSYTLDSNTTTARETTYNALARAKFLRDKPVNGGAFYERTHDAQPVGPAQSLLTENTRYGFDTALLRPLTPVPVRLDVSSWHSTGTGSDQVIDSRTDDLRFRADREHRGLGSSDFTYQYQKVDSLSGSLGLPILQSVSTTQRADLNTDLHVGARKQYDLFSTLSYNRTSFAIVNGSEFDSKVFRFLLNLNGRPSDTLQTRARYEFNRGEQSGGETAAQTVTQNVFGAGATLQATPGLSGTLDATATLSQGTPGSSKQSVIIGTASYRTGLPLGELSATAGLGASWRDQTAAEPVAHVQGEHIMLPGTAWVQLRSQLIITATIVVSNAQRTQTFTEGIDYAVRVIGLDTQIQRLIGGNILDGQEVLVDYDFDTGGTFAMTELDSSIDLNWHIKDYFSVFARYYDSAPHLVSGASTAPMNPGHTFTYGLHGDLPFTLATEELRVGARAEWEDRQEVISPYRRSTLDGYVETTVPLLPGTVRLGASRQKTTYPLTPQNDVETRTGNLRWFARLRGAEFIVDATRTHDQSIPELTRDYSMLSAKMRWRIRRVLATLEFYRTRESQMYSERTHARGQFTLRRDF